MDVKDNAGSRYRKYSRSIFLCRNCGREVEIGETCNCNQPPYGIRATCPRFRARTNYRGKAYIDCTNHRRKFANTVERNRWYAAVCCCGGVGCERQKGSGNDGEKHEG